MGRTTVILIRHAPTHQNDTYVMLGRTDPSLHARGSLLAQSLADALIGIPFDVVMTSPLLRARETAKRILRGRQADSLVIDARLSELDLGVVDGMSSFTAYERYKAQFDAALDPNSTDFSFPQGERWSDAVMRMNAVLKDVQSRHDRQTVCMVTHGALLGLWKSQHLGEPLGHFRLHQPKHASFSVLQHTGDNWSIVRWGDTAHLQSDVR
ncbi:histidine phosphatase family protein [Alicyclobacillus fastidiosus]|uniref:Histidine phosphatase family protein n=1 Tax=Alicyclobacillus fastidiosus TaxID=392011 RepID=A0ABY6ZLV8_9BACL|nr:histidine phosphatase family protein [Alicyclobacillus fastidiosus]WAH43898.1 histidine phosphatase family protein [Alicyclobacillus fastidiosus]GMA60142.1 phosphoglycerate mutase [Alicyclobacillus fastidiosus]